MEQAALRSTLAVLLLILLYIECVRSNQCSQDVTWDGYNQTIIQRIPKDKTTSDQLLHWQLQLTEVMYMNVTECYISKSLACKSILSKNMYTSTIYQDGDVYMITLTIHKVFKTRDQGKVSLYQGSNQLSQCDLVVHYKKATVTEFVSNAKKSSISGVDKTNIETRFNDTITFICEAEGNPKPVLSVRAMRSNETVPLEVTPIGDFRVRGTGKKTMTCLDYDDYQCLATNEFAHTSNKILIVDVICPPEYPPWFDQRKRQYFQPFKQEIEMQVPVIAYKDPRTEVFCPNDFNVYYFSGQFPNGTVIIKFCKEAIAFISMTCLVNISIGKESLQYEFEIVNEFLLVLPAIIVAGGVFVVICPWLTTGDNDEERENGTSPSEGTNLGEPRGNEDQGNEGNHQISDRLQRIEGLLEHLHERRYNIPQDQVLLDSMHGVYEEIDSDGLISRPQCDVATPGYDVISRPLPDPKYVFNRLLDIEMKPIRSQDVTSPYDG